MREHLLPHKPPDHTDGAKPNMKMLLLFWNQDLFKQQTAQSCEQNTTVFALFYTPDSATVA